MAAGCSLVDPQHGLTLRDVMNAEYDAPDATTQAEDSTDKASGSQFNCVEAYSTAEGDYFRVETRKGAREQGATVKDGFVVNYIVMDFEGKSASAERQLWAVQALSGLWNDNEGDYPARG